LPNSKNAGKVQTVLGVIRGEDLGITLPHEHLMCDLSKAWFVEPATAGERFLAYQPVKLENLHWLRHNAASNLDNLQLWDERVIISEVLRYKCAGGNSIVDVSSIGLGRDPLALQRIARATGLNVIMGTGFYIDRSHFQESASKAEEEFTEEIVQDITVGVGQTGVSAGIIGEIGCSYPLTEIERKVLRAAAQAQQRTGAPLNIHPGYPHESSPFEIADVLGASGADLTRTVISHMQILSSNIEKVFKLADMGCYIEYDQFGRSGFSISGSKFVDVPSDGQCINMISQLIKQGYLNQILISHDICLKMRLSRYGGSGYFHILYYVVPLMRAMGILEEHIRTLLIDNPKRLLQFV
jgi:phosphotriesterase-related protein